MDPNGRQQALNRPNRNAYMYRLPRAGEDASHSVNPRAATVSCSAGEHHGRQSVEREADRSLQKKSSFAEMQPENYPASPSLRKVLYGRPGIKFVRDYPPQDMSTSTSSSDTKKNTNKKKVDRSKLFAELQPDDAQPQPHVASTSSSLPSPPGVQQHQQQISLADRIAHARARLKLGKAQQLKGRSQPSGNNSNGDFDHELLRNFSTPGTGNNNNDDSPEKGRHRKYRPGGAGGVQWSAGRRGEKARPEELQHAPPAARCEGGTDPTARLRREGETLDRESSQQQQQQQHHPHEQFTLPPGAFEVFGDEIVYLQPPSHRAVQQDQRRLRRHPGRDGLAQDMRRHRQHRRGRDGSSPMFDPYDACETIPEPRPRLPRWCWCTILLVVLLVSSITVGIILGTKKTRRGSPSGGAVGAVSPPAVPALPPTMHVNQDSDSFPGDPQWVLLGKTVMGSLHAPDHFGRTVAISADGSRFAASSSSSNKNNNNISSSNDVSVRDYVRVYRYFSSDNDHNLDSDNHNAVGDGEWVQLGDDFETLGPAFVDLASNGLIVSIATLGGMKDNNTTATTAKRRTGSVKLYEWRDNNSNTSSTGWYQIGQTIVATEESGSRYFGYETKVSENGKVVVVDDPGADVTTVYAYNGSYWTRVGQPIVRDPSVSKFFEEDPSGDFSRSSVSISSMGTVVATGGRDGDRGSFARVYELLANDPGANDNDHTAARWTRRGLDLSEFYGASEKLRSNTLMSVSLSSDGRTLAIADRDIDVDLGKEGAFQIVELDDGNREWKVTKQVGGRQVNGRMGTSVSLSGDGRTCAVGIPFGSGYGRTEIYHATAEGKWEKIGQTIQAASIQSGGDGGVGVDVGVDSFGAYVAIASDGRTVAIADETHRANNGAEVGSVSVFRLVYIPSTK